MLRRQLDFTPPPRTPIRLTYSLRILQHQQIITLDELTGLVVVKVLALVGDFAVSGRGGTIPARIGDVLAVVGGSGTRDGYVGADLAACDTDREAIVPARRRARAPVARGVVARARA
jgi:hypothetical protein